MRRAGIALTVCILLMAVTHGLATDYRKLSGYVRLIASQPSVSASRGVSVTPGRTLTAFVKTNGEPAGALWAEHGCRLHARQGNISIVSIPIEHIGSLSDHPAVSRIEASPRGHLCMDTTAIVVGSDKIAQPSPTIGQFTGDGVVVGVMDVGFDLTHPNFYDRTASRYRIGACWDQLSRDTVGSTLPVGRDYVGAEAILALQHSADGLLQTHGTHTLGIAAGSGYQSPYKGIATDADICVVANAVDEDIALIDSADLEKYTTATDALGFKYIFDYADSKGRPCVASFSEGYPPYLDQEDSLYAAFLDSLSGPGRIIVAAAGNEGYAQTYAAKHRDAATAGAFVGANSKKALYRVKADGPLTLALYAYTADGSSASHLRFTSEAIPIDTLITDTLFVSSDTCIVSLKRYPSSFATDTIYNIQLQSAKVLNQLLPIALVMEGAGTEAELFGSSTSKLTSHSAAPQWNAARPGRNVHAPGCFPSVICVGSTAHRLGFTNYKGEYKDYSEGCIAGRLSPYSSTGPAMNGTMKPNITAPGDNIVSSYSSFYIEHNPEARDINSDVEHFDFQGRTYAWNSNTGTSMATPVVAGVIALWLQAKPDLSPEEVMTTLSLTSRQPDPALTYPNNSYGYGEIDAYLGLLHILGVSQVETISHHQPRLLQCRMENGRIRLDYGDVPTAPLTVSLYSLKGLVLHQCQVAPGVTTLPMPQLTSGLFVIQTNSNDQRFTGSQIINYKQY